MLHREPESDAGTEGVAQHVDLSVAKLPDDHGEIVAHVDQADRT
jgi:hypothetical protein